MREDKTNQMNAEDDGAKSPSLSQTDVSVFRDDGAREQAENDQISDAEIIEDETVAVVPRDFGAHARFGYVFLIATFGVFLLWAVFVPLSSALVARGEVVVNSYRKSIQHFEGGTVAAIHVRDGDHVNSGDLLIELDATAFEAQKTSNTKQLYTAAAELERLVAEQNFSPELQFSQELIDAGEKDEDVKNALAQQRQLFYARLKAFTQERDALKTRTEQTEKQLIGLRERSAILREQTELLKEEESAFLTLFNEGLGDSQRARELKRIILATQNEQAQVDADAARLKVQLTETALQVANREQEYLKEVGERIKQVQTDYYRLKENDQILSDRLQRSKIRAPVAGIVVDMQLHNVGSVAGPGKTLLDLVPEQRSYVVEARLQVQDINNVYPGQGADIRFSAFNSRITQVVEGKIEYISADRLLDERDGAPYYLTRIRVTEEGQTHITEDMELLPGMPAEVMIKAKERTLMSYFLKPLSDSFARSFKEV